MFKIRPHESRSLKWWFSRREMIDMAPTYQRRGSLWSPAKRALLMDSVINGFDLPKFYFADFNYGDNRLNEKGRSYAVVDGKQRLEALFGFLDDQLALATDFKFRKNPKLPIAGLTYRQIREEGFGEIIETVENFQPTVISVISDDEEIIDELFVRLNSGIAVSGAERRNAMPGPIPKVIRKLATHRFFTHNISFATHRMQEFNVVAKLLFIECVGELVETKARNLDRFVFEGVHDPARKYDEAASVVSEGLSRLADVFKENDRLLSSSGEIPVYYWLARNSAIPVKRMRPFLEWFQEQVRQNFEKQKNGASKVDAQLSDYYRMSRTTNDKASLEGRYETLLRWWKKAH